MVKYGVVCILEIWLLYVKYVWKIYVFKIVNFRIKGYIVIIYVNKKIRKSLNIYYDNK